MTIDLYAIAVPTFTRGLGGLSTVLDKAAAHCEGKRIDPAVLAATRLIPDMLPLSRQVQIACDFAKNGSARIAGIEPPAFADEEKTIQELKARIARTLEWVGAIDPAAIAAGDGRIVRFPMGPKRTGEMEAGGYLLHYVLPNFYFHVTTAYAILRASGIDIGKIDYMGDVPGLRFV